MKEYIAIVIFAIVYVLIVGRIRFKIPIWIAMLIGAALMLAFQIIGPENAIKSIQLDVIMFLFGMFSIVSALEKSGVLKLFAIKMLSKSKTPNSLLMMFVIGMGLLSAFLVNDTIALVGIPLVIYISKHLEIRPTVFLIALAFGVTVGSVMTPIGNPQNLLIALQSGISLPLVTYMQFLAIATLVNLFLTFFILKMYFKKDLLHATVAMNSKMLEGPVVEHPRLAKLSVVVLVATIAGFFVSEILHFVHLAEVPISLVAMAGAAVLYAASSQRRKIIKKVDYAVLVFFVAMFVVTAALWDSGAILLFMKHIPTPNPSDVLQSNALISVYSVTFSQILSNVPFVNLYNYIMIANGFTGAHVVPWMMLAASSTISGNLTILGAASTVIIIQAAESRGVRTFSFPEFLKIGSIVTMSNLAVYYMFLAIF